MLTQILYILNHWEKWKGGRKKDGIFVFPLQWFYCSLLAWKNSVITEKRKWLLHHILLQLLNFPAWRGTWYTSHCISADAKFCNIHTSSCWKLSLLLELLGCRSSHGSEMSLFCRSSSSSSTVSFSSEGESLTWNKSCPQTASSQAAESNPVSSSSSEYFGPAGHPAATSTIFGEAETVPAADPHE